MLVVVDSCKCSSDQKKQKAMSCTKIFGGPASNMQSLFNVNLVNRMKDKCFIIVGGSEGICWSLQKKG